MPVINKIIHSIGKINNETFFGIRFAGLLIDLLKGQHMKQALFAISFIFFISQVSFAQVYKWVDEKGVTHFTDDVTQVPEKYRSKSEKIGMPVEREETKDEGDLTPQKGVTKGEGETTPKKKEETYKDRLGRGEDYWKGQVEQWRTKLKELQDKLDALRTKYNGLTERFNESKNTAERANLRRERDQVKNEMDQCKTQMDEARAMLEKKIPEEAEFYKAKPEWVKQ